MRSTLILLLSLLGLCYSTKAEQQVNIDSLVNATEQSTFSDSDKGDLYFKIANYYNDSSEVYKALEYYQKARIDFENSDDTLRISRIYFSLGEIYTDLSDYERSIKYKLLALKGADLLNDQNVIVEIKQSLAADYFAIEQNKNAAILLEEIKAYIEVHLQDNAERTIQFYKVYSANLIMTSQFDSAKFYIQKGLELIDTYGYIELKGDFLNHLGAIYLNLNDLKNAQDNFEEFLSHAKKHNNEMRIAMAKSNLAIVLRKNKDYNKAKEYLMSSIKTYSIINKLSHLEKSYNQLAGLYETTGELDSSIYYTKLVYETKNKIKSTEIQEKILNMKQQYELDKIVEENQLEIDLINNKRKLDNYKYARIIGLLAFIVLLSVWFSYKNKMKHRLTSALLDRARLDKENNLLEKQNLLLEKKSLQDEVSFKNKELAHLASHMVNKNELLEELKKEIQNSNSSESKKIGKIVNENLNFETDIKKFEVYLDEIHHSFIYNLKQNHSSLTEKDIRLASLLILNLSSKEIASILKITSQSVDLKRHRLRKKMNVVSGKNIIEVLTSYCY